MERIILYGAGKVGDENYKTLEYIDEIDRLCVFCDKNAEIIKEKNGKRVVLYDEAIKLNVPFVISVSVNSPVYKEIKSKLEYDEVEYYNNLQEYIFNKLGYDRVQYNRKFCAGFHVTSMDGYFDAAESDSALEIFWGEDSLFNMLFAYLDLSNVVELACGRGRHVPQYIDRAGEVTLVDILEENIEYVRNRFSDYSNISYYKNNGYDLAELQDNEYTSLFCYDAMVHFELMDIYSYLKETYRILVPGGYALIHHSNDSSDYKNSFGNCSNPGGRSFMDKKIFAYLAYRAGFEIVEQHVIDWSEPEMDCITLLKKGN